MKKFISPLLFSILLLSTALYSQNTFRGVVSDDLRRRFNDYGFTLCNDIIGPRGMGMGGANIAATNDPTAVYFNPASLSSLSGINITFSGKMNFDSQDHNQPPLGGFSVTTSITPMLTPDFATLSYSRKIGNRTLTAAVGYRKYLDMTTKMESTQFYYGGGRIAERENNRGGQYAVSPSLAINVLPSLSVGATFNKIMGKSDFELRLVSPYADQYQFFKFKDKEEYSGYSFETGMLWTPVRWLSFGATISPKWPLTIEEAAEELQITEDIYKAPTIITTPTSQLSTFKIDIPAELGVGIALKPLSNTTIEADIKSQHWSDVEIASSLENVNPIANLVNNTLNWHVGVEQMIAGVKWKIPVRFGLFSIESPYQDKLFKGVYEGDQIKQNGWSIGIGVHNATFGIDFAFVRSSYKFGWWMTSSDYYNERMFETTDRFNRALLSFTLNL